MKFKNLLLLGLIVALFASCGEKITDENEDDTPDPEPQETSYRLKEMLEGEGEYQSKVTFEYEDNQLIKFSLWDFDGKGWVEEMKYDVAYTANEIIFSGSEIEEGIEFPMEEMKYTLDGDNITQETYSEYYYNELIVEYRTDYEYDGNGNILSYNTFENYGEMIVTESAELFYENGVLKEMLCSRENNEEELELVDRITYDFEGALLKTLTEYDMVENDWELDTEFTYFYNSENQVTKISSRHWFETLQEWLDLSDQTFEYDENNCLIKNDWETENYQYVYEEGQGNANMIFRNPEELFYFHPSPKDGEKKFSIRPLYERLNIKK